MNIQPIRNEVDYEVALERIAELMSAEVDTPEGEQSTGYILSLTGSSALFCAVTTWCPSLTSLVRQKDVTYNRCVKAVANLDKTYTVGDVAHGNGQLIASSLGKAR